MQQWFNVFYTPNRHTQAPLEFRGQVWGTRTSASQLLAALRRGHAAQGMEGWYIAYANTGRWI